MSVVLHNYLESILYGVLFSLGSLLVFPLPIYFYRHLSVIQDFMNNTILFSSFIRARGGLSGRIESLEPSQVNSSKFGPD